MSPIIDVVIPAHKKDLDILNHCVKSIRRNIKDVRRVIVVSAEKYTDEAEWFDEKKFPFSFQEINSYVNGVRPGWYLQQLCKLYAAFVIPGISDNVLIVDSDTVFFQKVTMFSGAGQPLYNLSKDQNLDQDPFYRQAIEHIGKLLPELNQRTIPAEFRRISGICHHMLLQKKVLEDLFARVEKQAGTGEKFYQIFLRHSKGGLPAAEYNLYFWFILVYYFEQIKIRKLKYKNTADLGMWRYELFKKYHYCSFHSYMRDTSKTHAQILYKIILFVENFFSASINN